MDFSIIIASFDRPESLDRLLTGLAEHFVKSSIDFEILLANNARGDDAAGNSMLSSRSLRPSSQGVSAVFENLTLANAGRRIARLLRPRVRSWHFSMTIFS